MIWSDTISDLQRNRPLGQQSGYVSGSLERTILLQLVPLEGVATYSLYGVREGTLA